MQPLRGQARIQYKGDMSYATARKWGQWGEKQLSRLKSVLHQGRVINQVYEPVKDIVVHVKSVNGLDNVIVYNTAEEISCKFPKVPVCGARCSDFQLQCDPPGYPESDIRIGFLSRTPNDDDWSQYIWDYGRGLGLDWGNWTNKHQTAMIYPDPGEYTITLTVKKYESVSQHQITPTIVPGGTYYKQGIAELQADAQALFDAAAWVSTPGMEGSGAHYQVLGRKNINGVHTFIVQGVKVAYQVDLSPYLPEEVESAILTMDFEYWKDCPGFNCNGGTNPGTDIESSLGGTIDGLEYNTDVTHLVGSSFQIEYRDQDEDYDPLPTIPVPVASRQWWYWRGWYSGQPDDVDVETVPGGWTILKTTKTIKVNVGSPKKTRQVGESIHEDISP